MIFKYKDLTVLSEIQFWSKITFPKTVCVTGLVQRFKPVKVTFDLIVYFEYSIVVKFSNLRICHFDTTKIESVSFIKD